LKGRAPAIFSKKKKGLKLQMAHITTTYSDGKGGLSQERKSGINN
jgi:hypothetical protein